MIGDILTGGDLHAADLPVVGVVTQLHHAGELQLQSQNIKNFSIWMDPDQEVGHCHELEVSLLGIREENLRLPDGLDQLGVRQVQRLLQREREITSSAS